MTLKINTQMSTEILGEMLTSSFKTTAIHISLHDNQ